MNLYTLRDHAKRLARAWRFATNRLTPADAQWISYECDSIAGVWALSNITAESVLSRAQDLWGDNPELERLSYDAARRVANQWSGSGEDSYSAEYWAIELIREYAQDENVELIEQD